MRRGIVVLICAALFALVPGAYAWANGFSVLTTMTTSGVSGVAYANGYVVQAEDAGVLLFDTSTNSLAHTITTTGVSSPRSAAADGTKVYIANDSGNVTIVDTVALTATVVSSGGACANPDRLLVAGSRLYVTCVGNNRVSVLNLVTQTFITTLNVGVLPRQPSLAGGRVYVPNENSNTVSVIQDGAAPTVIATTPVGSMPVSSVASGAQVYVTNFAGNTVSVINSATNLVTATISVGNGPQAAAVCAGRVVVTNRHDGTGSFIDPATNGVSTTSFSMGSVLHAVSANAGYAYFADYAASTISAVDCTSETLSGSIPVTSPQDMTFSGAGAGYFPPYFGNTIVVGALPSAGQSEDSSEAGRTPPPWLRQVGRAEGDSCDVEWNPSWAEWPNGGSGGFVCTQTLVWSYPLAGYVVG